MADCKRHCPQCLGELPQARRYFKTFNGVSRAVCSQACAAADSKGARELNRDTGEPGPYHYDGHGINAGDKYASRLLTFARQHADDGGGYVLNSDGRRRIGETMARAFELRDALRELLEYTPKGADIGDGWHYQRQAAAQRAALLLRQLEELGA